MTLLILGDAKIIFKSLKNAPIFEIFWIPRVFWQRCAQTTQAINTKFGM